MSLSGKAAVVIWNDISAGAKSDFLAWHNREHIPERVGIRGFLRGRRCRAVSGGPEFLTIYEVSEIGVLHRGPYLDRLNAPTEWTKRVLPQFRGAKRSLCRVEVSMGAGVGGFLGAAHWPQELTVGDVTMLAREAIAALDRAPQLLGLHLLATDLAASGQDIAEKRHRAEEIAIPASVLLVEAADETAAAETLTTLIARFDKRGSLPGADAQTAIYRHELCLAAADCGSPEAARP